MEHLALSGGKPALSVPVHQRLDNRGNLQQITTFNALHIFAVAMVPVRRHIDTQIRDCRENPLDLLCRRDRTNADHLAVFRRDLERQAGNRHPKNIKLNKVMADFFLNNAVDHTGAVHRMHDLIPHTKHDTHFLPPVINTHVKLKKNIKLQLFNVYIIAQFQILFKHFLLSLRNFHKKNRTDSIKRSGHFKPLLLV